MAERRFDCKLRVGFSKSGPEASTAPLAKENTCVTLQAVMGLTRQKLLVKESRRARRKAAVRFLIDSGAVYSLVPAVLLRKLRIRPYRKVDFTLADGTAITRQVG